jgi:hypothetical protein
MNRLSQKQTTEQMLNDLAKLDAWTEEPLLARNAIPGTPTTVQRFREIAAEQGVATEEILSRALATLEAQARW